MNRGSLSVCIIARNESGRIARAIASVRDVADEIVVTDTGSTDDTAAVAASLGARVEYFPWADDFAAAYNACLAHATRAWVLQLDADEELVAGARDELRHALARNDAFAFTVLREDLSDTSGGRTGTKMRLPRLFRNSPQVRFVGRIHHRFTVPLDDLARGHGQAVFDSSIALTHYGYLGGDKRGKLLRAARLMELELAERPGQFYFLVELGRTYDQLGDPRALTLLADAAAMVDRGAPGIDAGTLAMLLEWVLAVPNLPAGFPLTRADAARRARADFPRSVPLLWQLARRDFADQRYADCAELLERIRALAESETYDQTVSFDPRILREEVVLNLGACYTRLARLRDAERCFENLLDQPSVADRAAANLQVVRGLLKS
jgi:hypothetical protein